MIRERGLLNQPTFRLALLAILTAVVTVLTMAIAIPVPATQGYINLGDTGVLFAGLLLGPVGGVAGGVGSALADFMLGYTLYVPITFVVKGLEGTITGLVFFYLKRMKKIMLQLIIAVLIGSSIMITGYLLAETGLFGFAAAIVEVPGNIFQVTFGSVIAVIAFLAVNRAYLTRAESSV